MDTIDAMPNPPAIGQADGLDRILMELVDGVNLAQIMKTGRICPREALAIVPQICEALQSAHDQGIAQVVAAVCEDPPRNGGNPVPTDQTLAGKIIGPPNRWPPSKSTIPPMSITAPTSTASGSSPTRY